MDGGESNCPGNKCYPNTPRRPRGRQPNELTLTPCQCDCDPWMHAHPPRTLVGTRSLLARKYQLKITTRGGGEEAPALHPGETGANPTQKGTPVPPNEIIQDRRQPASSKFYPVAYKTPRSRGGTPKSPERALSRRWTAAPREERRPPSNPPPFNDSDLSDRRFENRS